MFYDELDKIDPEDEVDYCWEMIDGMPRYRWYKNALNTLYFIEICDDKFDIEDSCFSDLKYHYDSVHWVAQNDPEALEYIMSELQKPVTHIVKKKFLENLEKLEYYRACGIVKEHLVSHQAPAERTFIREKEKAFKNIDYLMTRINTSSELLYEYKTENQEELYDKKLEKNMGVLFTVAGMYKDDVFREVGVMDWFRENSPEDLEKMFDKKICKEIKDQVLNIAAKLEKFELCNFLKQIIKTYEFSDYFEVPPYTPPEEFFSDYEDYED